MIIFSTDLTDIYGSYEAVDAQARDNLEFDDEVEITQEMIDEEVLAMYNDNIDDIWDTILSSERRDPASWVVSARIGRWDGVHDGGNVFSSIETAFDEMTKGVDDWKAEEDEEGNVVVTGYHHDGTNCFELRRLRKKGEIMLERNKFEDRGWRIERLMQEDFSRPACLSRYFGWA